MKKSDVPLSNLRLESSALGAAILDRAHAEVLIRDGREELFTTNFTRTVFTAIKAVGPDGAGDCAVLVHELERQGESIDWGALCCLDDGIIREIPEESYLARLRELWRLRQFGSLGEWLAQRPFEAGTTSAQIITEVRARLEAIQ